MARAKPLQRGLHSPYTRYSHNLLRRECLRRQLPYTKYTRKDEFLSLLEQDDQQRQASRNQPIEKSSSGCEQPEEQSPQLPRAPATQQEADRTEKQDTTLAMEVALKNNLACDQSHQERELASLMVAQFWKQNKSKTKASDPHDKPEMDPSESAVASMIQPFDIDRVVTKRKTSRIPTKTVRFSCCSDGKDPQSIEVPPVRKSSEAVEVSLLSSSSSDASLDDSTQTETPVFPSCFDRQRDESQNRDGLSIEKLQNPAKQLNNSGATKSKADPSDTHHLQRNEKVVEEREFDVKKRQMDLLMDKEKLRQEQHRHVWTNLVNVIEMISKMRNQISVSKATLVCDGILDHDHAFIDEMDRDLRFLVLYKNRLMSKLQVFAFDE